MLRLTSVVLLLLGVGLAYYYTTTIHNPFWGRLKSLARQGQTPVYVHQLTDFSWDTVCVLEPYSLGPSNLDPDKLAVFIPAELGRFREHLPNLNDDGAWAFVFVKAGAVIKIEERGTGFYLYKDYVSNCMSKDTAAFIITGEKIYISDGGG